MQQCSKEAHENEDARTKNLMHFNRSITVRGAVPLLETSLTDKNQMPLKSHTVGRLKYLAKSMKGRKERVAE